LALTYPHTPHAVCGSFGFPHFGQGLRVTGLRAWCARRVRVRHLDVFLAGSIAAPRLYGTSPCSRNALFSQSDATLDSTVRTQIRREHKAALEPCQSHTEIQRTLLAARASAGGRENYGQGAAAVNG
jgi:hypothetical protein